MSTATIVGFDAVIKDVRHLDARAADDLAAWLVYQEVKGLADRSLYAYMRLVARFIVMYPSKAIEDFTDTDIEGFLATIPRPTRHVPRSILAQFFKWAKVKGRIERDPMEKVVEIKAQRSRPRDIFSEAEIALLEAQEELWTILFGTGIRRGEARYLRREHIDLNRARLVVYGGKGDKDRIVPLPLNVQRAVADLDLQAGLGAGDHLWYTRRGKRKLRRDPIADTTFSRWYERGIEAAGVRYLNPHQTRHTYGHRLRELGFDLEERQLLMGHESVRTTQRYYGRLTIEDVARKMQEVGV